MGLGSKPVPKKYFVGNFDETINEQLRRKVELGESKIADLELHVSQLLLQVHILKEKTDEAAENEVLLKKAAAAAKVTSPPKSAAATEKPTLATKGASDSD